MRIRVHAMDSYEARVANTHLPTDELEYQNDVQCEGVININSARIIHGGADEFYRPYLKMSGNVNSLRGSFINKVTEMHFPQDKNQPEVDIRYDFTDDELAQLCQKGLFDKGFQLPELLTNNNGFEIPIVCDICSVKNTDVPLLFVNVKHQFNIDVNSETTGYDLVAYFEDVHNIINEFEAEEDTIEDIRTETLEDDMFESEKPKEPERVEEVEHKELTDEEKAFNKSLVAVEQYAEKKVTERYEALDAKKDKFDEIKAEDEHSIREEIKADSIESKEDYSEKSDESVLAEIRDTAVKSLNDAIETDNTVEANEVFEADDDSVEEIIETIQDDDNYYDDADDIVKKAKDDKEANEDKKQHIEATVKNMKDIADEAEREYADESDFDM